MSTDNMALVVDNRLTLSKESLVATAQQLDLIQEFVKTYLVESDIKNGVDGDYGILPGVKKKTLFKSGAEKLCELYNLIAKFEIIQQIEDWDKKLFDYTVKCSLFRDGVLRAEGMASCNTWEDNRRYKNVGSACPNCGKPLFNDKNGSGSYCWIKKEGCGKTFDFKATTTQVEIPNIYGQKNVVLKMAEKRALVDATIRVTRSSSLFTQDMEDYVDYSSNYSNTSKDTIDAEVIEKPKAAPKPKAVAAPKAAPTPVANPEPNVNNFESQAHSALQIKAFQAGAKRGIKMKETTEIMTRFVGAEAWQKSTFNVQQIENAFNAALAQAEVTQTPVAIAATVPAPVVKPSTDAPSEAVSGTDASWLDFENDEEIPF